MKLTNEQFGVTPEGREVRLFSLTNEGELEVKITNYGGIITAINAPDRHGRFDDIALGHDSFDGYLKRSRYFGALIGRYANRIARGQFSLNGDTYRLATNNGENHLHGGLKGFDKVVWEAGELPDGLQLSYLSRDGEEGYPGNVHATVTYRLTDANELRIEYQATTDRETIINLTNHSYFNLAGGGTILDHVLTINAEAFTPVDKGLIPTGELRAAKGTPMDFTSAKPIGSRINENYEQLRLAGGYDHNFVLRESSAPYRIGARIHEPKSGRVMEVSTTQPGMQFYSGNFLDGSIVGKGGVAYTRNSGCCFETQHFPDSPNHREFPSTVLRPGEIYHHTTGFRFFVDHGEP
jgi:aldose 1-epimerase